MAGPYQPFGRRKPIEPKPVEPDTWEPSAPSDRPAGGNSGLPPPIPKKISARRMKKDPAIMAS